MTWSGKKGRGFGEKFIEKTFGYIGKISTKLFGGGAMKKKK